MVTGLSGEVIFKNSKIQEIFDLPEKNNSQKGKAT